MQGTLLGGHRILSSLGSGGMGEVFLAECVESHAGLASGTRVALKVLHRHLLGQPGFFKRFMREADIGRQVRHENVVKTYDCDATLDAGGQQQNFLVMELVEGQTLRQLLHELERVPEALCRDVGREVAQGLAAIHAVGVLHRDIKPVNVLITAEHVVKVMDLGVARLHDEAVRLSQAGSFVGSLEYAAPEQFRTRDGEPDGRADLHALGLFLYELATGHHPHRGEDASRVLRSILDVEPRKVGELNPQLSPFFEGLVQTLVAKNPAGRLASADALVATRCARTSRPIARSWRRPRSSSYPLGTPRRPSPEPRTPRPKGPTGNELQKRGLVRRVGGKARAERARCAGTPVGPIRAPRGARVGAGRLTRGGVPRNGA